MQGKLNRAEDLSGSVTGLIDRLDRLERWVNRIWVGQTIHGGRLTPGTLSSALMKKGIQAYQTGAEFTCPAWNRVAWEYDFAIRFADDTYFWVTPGSLTLANDNPYYLYWQSGLAALQSTQIYSDVLGDNKALVAIVQRPPAGHNPTTQKSFVHTVKGLGEAIHSGVISANAVITSHLQAESVTSEKITAGQIIAKNFRTAPNVGEAGGPAGIRFNASEIAGYSGGTTKMFYLEATTGKAYCAGGAVVLDSLGVLVKGKLLHFQDGDGLNDAYAWVGVGGNLCLEAAVGKHIRFQSDFRLSAEGKFGPHADFATYVFFWTKNTNESGNLDHGFCPTTPMFGFLGDSTYCCYAYNGYFESLFPQSGSDTGAVGIATNYWQYGYVEAKQQAQEEADRVLTEAQVKIAQLVADPGIDLGKSVGLAFGAIRQIADRLDSLEARLVALRGKEKYD